MPSGTHPISPICDGMVVTLIHVHLSPGLQPCAPGVASGSQTPGSVVDVSVRYSPTLRTRITAAYSQEFTTDVEGTLYWQKRADVGLERQLGPRTLLRLTSFYSQLNVGAEGEGDNNYLGGGVKLEHRLRRRVLVDATWNYWKNGGGAAFDAPVLVPELNGPFESGDPEISADGRTMAFSATGFGAADYELFIAERSCDE